MDLLAKIQYDGMGRENEFPLIASLHIRIAQPHYIYKKITLYI